MDIGAGFSKPMIRGLGFNRIAVSENVIKVIQDNDLEMGYNPLTQMLSTYETPDLPENFNDDCWDDCTVGDYIRFKITGKLPNEE
jgi:hypothetical protein